MKKAGIIIIIILFITSGALAVLYQRSISHITTPPQNGEEIVIPPTIPAIENGQQEALEISFILDSRVEEKNILITPNNNVREFCSVGTNGSIHFLFEDLCTLEEGKVNSWPELIFIWNNEEEQSVDVSLKKEKPLPPYLSLQAGFNRKTLQFDEQGFSAQRFQLEPGSRLSLGFTMDLNENNMPEEAGHWIFTIIVE